MQTTLLGIAIALILALVAALVGPHFVDWNQYRAEFETQASRLTGLTVGITGPIEARLLPTPTLTLGGVEIARPGQTAQVHARSLGIEFALGALVRGEWRATEARIEGADITVGLDRDGRLDWPAPTLGIEPETVSIQRLDIVDSRATLADAASGARVVLDKFEFKGELRSLLGPMRGEGSFVAGGKHYPYRMSASRIGDAGTRLRLNVEPIDRPLIADFDGFLSVEQGTPRFDGTVQIARPVGQAPGGIIEPWRISSRIKSSVKSAVLEQVEFQYGPDDRAVKLRGDASLGFGPQPELTVGLSAMQLDLDRMLGLSDPAQTRPLAAVKALADFVGGAQRPPIPVKLDISAESVTLAGAMLQRASVTITAQADSWTIEQLEFRAPGSTQVRLSGRLNLDKAIAFEGAAKIDARDGRALVGWLNDRIDPQTIAAGPVRVEGDVKLGSDTVAIDRLKAELDRITLAGRVAYSWPSGGRPARIEAALNAPDIDIDRFDALAQGMFGDGAFEWPREGALALKARRAVLAGVEARDVDVRMQFDGHGIDIEHVAVGDLGGAKLAIKGRLNSTSPGGSLTFDLDARALDGLVALVGQFSAPAAAELRARAARFVPAKLHMTLSAEPVRASATHTVFRVDGKAGTFAIDLRGDAEAPADAFAIANLGHLRDAKLSLTGRLDAGDGATLVQLLGLEPYIAVDNRAGRLAFSLRGSASGGMTVDGKLAAGGLDLSTTGTVRLSGDKAPVAGLAISIARAELRNPRPRAAGRPVETLPVSLTAKLALAGDAVAITDLVGKVAQADIGGRLDIGLGQPATIRGDIDVSELDLPGVIAAAIGVPAAATNAKAWPSEPFDRALLGNVTGELAVKTSHVVLTPKLAAKHVRSRIRFDRSELAFEGIEGRLAGGSLKGGIYFRRDGDGVSAKTHLSIAGADLAEIIRGGPPPLTGRMNVDVDLEGSGRSPAALIGDLKGGGTFTVNDGRIVRLDPAAFDAVIHDVDQGLPIDAERIRDRMDQALANGTLAVAQAKGQISVTAGQARLMDAQVSSEGADLSVGGLLLLSDDTIDVKLKLSGPERADGPAGARPEIALGLKGARGTPRRTLDVAAFANWLALRAVEQQSKRIDALEAARELSAKELSVKPEPDPAPPAAADTKEPPATAPAPAKPPRAARATSQRRRAVAPAVPATPRSGQTAPKRPVDLTPPAARGSSRLEGLFGSYGQ